MRDNREGLQRNVRSNIYRTLPAITESDLALIMRVDSPR